MARGQGTSTHILRVSMKPRLYRDIEILSDGSLESLAKVIVFGFGFDLDHAYGFFSKLTGNIFQSPIRYELFADMEGAGTSRSVKRTAVETAFPRIKSKMLFLYDHGDDWRFKVEVIGLGKRVSNAQYPRFVGQMGKAPPQYPDADDEEEE